MYSCRKVGTMKQLSLGGSAETGHGDTDQTLSALQHKVPQSELRVQGVIWVREGGRRKEEEERQKEKEIEREREGEIEGELWRLVFLDPFRSAHLKLSGGSNFSSMFWEDGLVNFLQRPNRGPSVCHEFHLPHGWILRSSSHADGHIKEYAKGLRRQKLFRIIGWRISRRIKGSTASDQFDACSGVANQSFSNFNFGTSGGDTLRNRN